MKETPLELKLDKSVPIPLYYQLKNQILERIKSGTLRDGDMIWPENELCERLGVSRPTVRQALSELVADGYLMRYKGRGTFVSKPKHEVDFFSRLESFNSETLAKGLTPSTRVLALKKISDPHEAHEKLGLKLEDPLIYLSRLRFADGVPVVYVETFLPHGRYAEILDVDLESNSLYDSLERLFGLRINRARREIEAVNASRKEAGLLEIAPGKALCLVKTLAYFSGSESPVEFSIARYRGDVSKFSLDISR